MMRRALLVSVMTCFVAYHAAVQNRGRRVMRDRLDGTMEIGGG
jgi:hypothetical protein